MTQRAFYVVEGRRSPHPPSTRLARVRSGLVHLVEVRRGRRLLAGLEPRMLADIGASRADARVEAARPWWDHGPPRPDAMRRRAR